MSSSRHLRSPWNATGGLAHSEEELRAAKTWIIAGEINDLTCILTLCIYFFIFFMLISSCFCFLSMRGRDNSVFLTGKTKMLFQRLHLSGWNLGSRSMPPQGIPHLPEPPPPDLFFGGMSLRFVRLSRKCRQVEDFLALDLLDNSFHTNILCANNKCICFLF